MGVLEIEGLDVVRCFGGHCIGPCQGWMCNVVVDVIAASDKGGRGNLGAMGGGFELRGKGNGLGQEVRGPE